MGKTIKQLADELGVSKTAVRKYMDEAFRAEHTKTTPGNIITIDEIGCRKVSASIKKLPGNSANQEPETPETGVSGNLVAVLQSTIEVLQQQLAAKDRQIEALTETVKTQAQSINAARHNELASTMQQLLPEQSQTVATTKPSQEKRRWWSWK